MQAIQVKKPAGLDDLFLVEQEARAPREGEVSVRIKASSLNYHDYVVAIGGIPCEDNRIPMSDGAGFVEAVGAGVTEFAVGDQVVSCFFPYWQDGEPQPHKMIGVPGDGADGFGCQDLSAKLAAIFILCVPIGYSIRCNRGLETFIQLRIAEFHALIYCKLR